MVQGGGRQDGLTWGSPYLFASTGDLGITLSAPIKDRKGDLWGVVGVDFSLKTLANLVLDYRLKHVGSSGFMYIGDAEGHLIGHSQLFEAQNALLANPKLTVAEATSIHKVHLSGATTWHSSKPCRKATAPATDTE